MKQVVHILKYKLLIFLRPDARFNFATFVKSFGSLIIYGGFAVGSFYFSQSIIKFILEEIKLGLFLLHEFISTVFFIFFVSVNVGNIIVSYSTLFKSVEVNFLFSKPVEPGSVFVLKFLDNFLYSSSTLLLILFSITAGYAFYFGLELKAILILVFLNFIPFVLTAGSLGAITLLVLIRLAAKYGVKKVLYVLIFAYLILVFLFFNASSPIDLVETVSANYPFLNKDDYLSNLIPTAIKYLPNKWLAEAAYWITQNNYAEVFRLTLIQSVVSAVVFAFALFLGKRWYFDSWLINLKITSEYDAGRKLKKGPISFGNKSVLKPSTEAIIKRDLLLFIREPNQILHFIVLVILIIIFISSVSGIKFIGIGNFYLQTGIYLAITLFNFLLISTLSLRFVFPLISLEGMAFWKIKSAPVENHFLLKRKLAIIGSIILFIGQGLSFFSNFNFGVAHIISSGLTTLAVTVSIVSLNFGMGGLFANYKEKNAIRLSSSQGASISFLFNIFYMLFVVLLLYVPMSKFFLATMLNREFNYAELLYPLPAVFIVSLIITYYFLKAGLKSLSKDF